MATKVECTDCGTLYWMGTLAAEGSCPNCGGTDYKRTHGIHK